MFKKDSILRWLKFWSISSVIFAIFAVAVTWNNTSDGLPYFLFGLMGILLLWSAFIVVIFLIWRFFKRMRKSIGVD